MDQPEDTWTDDQRIAYREWEFKQEEIREKNEKIKKMLEQSLNKDRK